MYIILVNSYAGKYRYKHIMNQLNNYLDTPFITYFSDHYEKDKMWEEIHEKITQIEDNLTGFLIVGGDGTLHQTIQRLLPYKRPFGLIPAGSGNDFGRALNISRNTKKAIERINQQKPLEYDLIEVNGRKVLSVVGIGVDAETALKCQNSKIKKWLNRIFLGSLAYITVFLHTMVSFRPLDVTIVDDKQEVHSFSRVWLMATGNSSYYGGGIPICPMADPQDGVLDLVVVHGLNPVQLLMVMPTVFLKKHVSLRYVTVLTGERFHIRSSENPLVQGDGEEIGHTPAQIKVIKKAIQIY